jgi:hypothetical protein
VPASILLADAAEAALRLRVAGTVIVVMLVAAGVWTQREGYKSLRTTKTIYGRVLDFVRFEAPPGGTVVTDLWWLDQVAAAAADSRQLLFAVDAQAAAAIMGRLDRASVPAVTVIRSRTESPDLDPWLGQTCYKETESREIADRELVAFRLTRSCP